MRHQTSTYESIFQKLQLVLDEYSASRHVTKNTYFAQKLGFKNEGAFSQHISPNSNLEKNITFREVLAMMDISTEFVKPLLDAICQKHGYICSKPASKESNEDFQELFLKVANINGDIAKTYLEAIEDGTIDQKEQKQLNDLLYQFRALIRGFEFDKSNKESDEY